MPSPFPGMNPYFEQSGYWPSFHTQMMTAFVAQLVPQLVPKYLVLLEERILLQEPLEGADRLLGRADMAIAPGFDNGGAHTGPLQRYIEIRDRDGRALVTVLELLSPSNKRPGTDRLQYLAKRATVLASPAHLVEIDLLRGGPPLPAIGTRPQCSFSVTINRASDRPRAGFWPIGLRDPLPIIPVPVQPEDSDARLDLKAALDRVYDEGGFSHLLYRREPDPRLSPEDAAWAVQFLPRPA